METMNYNEILKSHNDRLKDILDGVEALPQSQEKKVEITSNGTTEILPDDGYTLSKVTANVNVAASGENKLAQLIDKSITEVTAEDFGEATEIKECLFKDSRNLASVIMPNTITRIGQSTFYGCSQLLNITMSNNITEIGTSAFCACRKLTNIVIPDSVTTIGGYAFQSCQKLTSITIPDSVTSIGSHLFYDCYELKNAILGSGLTKITDNMFYGCNSLESLTIPDSVTRIGSRAFYYGSSLKSLFIPFNLTSISLDETFYGCSSLENIMVDENNAVYKSVDGILYSKDEKSLIKYTTGNPSTHFTIKEGVENIARHAFENSRNLTSVTIGNSVTVLEARAFYGCPNIAVIRVGNGITSIASNAFACKGTGFTTALTDVYIDKPEDSISGAPWGAYDATIHWNTPLPSEEV